MRLEETISASPITPEKTVRADVKRCLTSANAGKIVPLAYVPLLREDRISRGEMSIRVEMMETAEMLMNAVNLTVYAHFVPYLASERFNGMDMLNRAYMDQNEISAEGHAMPAVPFFPTVAFDRTAEFWRTMGMHAPDGEMVNAWPLEAYNLLVNFRRKARSKNLPLREVDDTTLAAAFWKHTGMSHIVPDFDAAVIDGEVPITIQGGTLLPVKGVGWVGSPTASAAAWLKESDGGLSSVPTVSSADYGVRLAEDEGFPAVFAEMQEMGITLSMQNLEMAKRTQAFAKIRERYDGIDDEFIVDLLMQGVRVPDEAMSQPILLDRRSTVMGYSRRFATDAANLAESVTSGETFVDLRMRTPPMNTGGIVIITAEVVPDQLFERQKDEYLFTKMASALPQFTRDYLDPEKVDIVPNDFVDVAHTDPDGTFGYAPLNHAWRRNLVNIGGKYYRPEVDAAFDEERQKFWAVETPDPALTEDFYLATQLHKKVFADTTADPLEFTSRGQFEIVGNTVFGRALEEDSDAMEDVVDEVDYIRRADADQTT